MKRLIFLSLIVTIGISFNSIAQSLKVHKSQSYLVNPNGTAFMWIGDKAYELFHKLNREEATEYLETGQRKDSQLSRW